MLERLETVAAPRGTVLSLVVGEGNDGEGCVVNKEESIFTIDAAAARCFSNVVARVRGPSRVLLM